MQMVSKKNVKKEYKDEVVAVAVAAATATQLQQRSWPRRLQWSVRASSFGVGARDVAWFAAAFGISLLSVSLRLV